GVLLARRGLVTLSGSFRSGSRGLTAGHRLDLILEHGQTPGYCRVITLQGAQLPGQFLAITDQFLVVLSGLIEAPVQEHDVSARLSFSVSKASRYTSAGLAAGARGCRAARSSASSMRTTSRPR